MTEAGAAGGGKEGPRDETRLERIVSAQQRWGERGEWILAGGVKTRAFKVAIDTSRASVASKGMRFYALSSQTNAVWQCKGSAGFCRPRDSVKKDPLEAIYSMCTEGVEPVAC